MCEPSFTKRGCCAPTRLITSSQVTLSDRFASSWRCKHLQMGLHSIQTPGHIRLLHSLQGWTIFLLYQTFHVFISCQQVTFNYILTIMLSRHRGNFVGFSRALSDPLVCDIIVTQYMFPLRNRIEASYICLKSSVVTSYQTVYFNM
jgi:hypothetical protein